MTIYHPRNWNNQPQIFKAMLTQIRDILATINLDNEPLNLSQVTKNIDVISNKITIIFELSQAQLTSFDKAKSQAERALKRIFPEFEIFFITTHHKAHKESSHLPIKHIIAVASGKGGVGKSTIAVNLAIALAHLGLRVGLLDADIYGPSIPKMLGIAQRPTTNQDKKIIPIEKFGIHSMSIGFLLDEEKPLIWRGPMAQGALMQLLKDVAWPILDVLLIDLPPGTGDIQLSLTQQANLSGAIIVSTPQDIALIDARKGLNMFRRVHVPILGMIENMSFFACPHCNETSAIFGHGGAMDEARRLDIPFLGSIALTLPIRTGGDEGIPITAAEPQSPISLTFNSIAQNIWHQL